MEISDNLFYLLFVGQIFLLSWYFPNKMISRVEHVLEAYPAETYPKLYPLPVAQYRSGIRRFRVFSRLVLVIGVAILLSVLFVVDHSSFAEHGYISSFWPAVYGMIQFVPFMAIEFSEYSNLKLMRQVNPVSLRTADLQRRGLFDLVSPWLVVLAVLTLAGAILFDLYLHGFNVSLGHDSVQRALVMLASNVMIALVGMYNLYGKKLDPHQSSADRSHRIAVNLRSLLYLSMAMSVFVGVSAADGVYDIDFLDAALMSFYFQAIGFLSLGYTTRNIQIDDTNFDVYKAEVPAVR